MARIRTIKPDFFKNEELAALSPLHRLLFIGLWTLCDREGRLEDRPKRIKVELLPYDDADVSLLLQDLASLGFISRYVVGPNGYISVPTFLKHQRPHLKEPKSLIPSVGECTYLALDEPGPDTYEPAGKGREGKGREGNKSVSSAPDGAEPAMTFPTAGDPASWDLSQAQIGIWQLLYPGIDVLQEARKALGWILANPGRKKTARGMDRFLNGWMGRAQDRGGVRGPSEARAFPRQQRPPAPTFDWADECQRLHAGACGSQFKHSLRMDSAS